MADSGTGTTNPPNSAGVIKKTRDKKQRGGPNSLDSLKQEYASAPLPKKLENLEEKYDELYKEYRSTSHSFKGTQKVMQSLQKKVEQLQSELNKALMKNSTLEDISRELQKYNKALKDANYSKLKEEENKRKLAAENFMEKLNAINKHIDEDRDNSNRLREENVKLSSKLSELNKQFQDRDTQLCNLAKQLELQKKLSEAQMKKLQIEFEATSELWGKERETLLSNLKKSDEANELLKMNNDMLNAHVDKFSKQCTGFEETMKKSNKVIMDYKAELNKLHKDRVALERTKKVLNSRYQAASNTMQNMTEKYNALQEEAAMLRKKNVSLENLCRKLQNERMSYIQQLKNANITPITPGDAQKIIIPEEQPVLNTSNGNDVNTEKTAEVDQKESHFVEDEKESEESPQDKQDLPSQEQSNNCEKYPNTNDETLQEEPLAPHSSPVTPEEDEKCSQSEIHSINDDLSMLAVQETTNGSLDTDGKNDDSHTSSST